MGRARGRMAVRARNAGADLGVERAVVFVELRGIRTGSWQENRQLANEKPKG